MDAMPEVKEMMKMKGQMESAVKDYDSSVPRMKAKLPAMKEVRDKKAKKVGARRPSFRRLSWRTLRRRRHHTQLRGVLEARPSQARPGTRMAHARAKTPQEVGQSNRASCKGSKAP